MVNHNDHSREAAQFITENKGFYGEIQAYRIFQTIDALKKTRFHFDNHFHILDSESSSAQNRVNSLQYISPEQTLIRGEDIRGALEFCAHESSIPEGLEPDESKAAFLSYALINLPEAFKKEHEESYLNSWFIMEGIHEGKEQKAVILRYQGHNNARYFCYGDPFLIREFIRHYPEQMPDTERDFRFVLKASSVKGKRQIGELINGNILDLSRDITTVTRRVAKKSKLNIDALTNIDLPGYLKKFLSLRMLNSSDTANLSDETEMKKFMLTNYEKHTHRRHWPPLHDGISLHVGVVDKKRDHKKNYLIAMAGASDMVEYHDPTDGQDRILGIIGDLVVDKRIRNSSSKSKWHLGSLVAAKAMQSFIAYASTLKRNEDPIVMADTNTDRSNSVLFRHGLKYYSDFYWCVAKRRQPVELPDNGGI